MWESLSDIVKRAKADYKYGYVDTILIEPYNYNSEEGARIYAQARILFGENVKLFNVKGHSWRIKFYDKYITFGETELLFKLSNVDIKRPYKYHYKGTVVTKEFNKHINKETKNVVE